MAERKTVSSTLVILLVVAAGLALYGTSLHMDRADALALRADALEQERRETARLSKDIATLRDSLAKRETRNEKMLISFIESVATKNRISMASITIDPGTRKEAARLNKFYKEVDTVVRIKQAPLKSIVLFIAGVQTEDPALRPKLLSLMPSQTDPSGWDARVVISYFVFDEEPTAGPGTVEDGR